MNTDFIIVHGSPGTGKTTLSRKMHDYFKSPYFEFGWIPEFRSLTPSIEITQRQEEQLTFENLILIAKNYNRHGFKNLIITDLDDVRMLDIPVVFEGFNYVILTLYSDKDEVIKQRILSRNNGNSYLDWETSINTNALIRRRSTLPNEYRVLNSTDDVEATFQELLRLLECHAPSPSVNSELSRSDFYSYIND